MLVSSALTVKQYFKASLNASQKSVSETITDTTESNKVSAASSLMNQSKEEHLKILLEVMKKLGETRTLTLFEILNERKPKTDEEESRKRRARQKRIDELSAQIAYHKKRVFLNPNNSRSDEAMVTSLTSKLTSVMFS